MAKICGKIRGAVRATRTPLQNVGINTNQQSERARVHGLTPLHEIYLRSILNDTSQKGSDGIDNSYDERKLPGPAHAPVFEARCIMAATVDGFTGLILHREAMGSSIKAAREAAAKKVVQHFLE